MIDMYVHSYLVYGFLCPNTSNNYFTLNKRYV